MVVRNARLIDLSPKTNVAFWSYSEPLGELKEIWKGGAFLMKGMLQLHPESDPACHCPVWQDPLAVELSREHSVTWN